jgi:hypothetical protein
LILHRKPELDFNDHPHVETLPTKDDLRTYFEQRGGIPPREAGVGNIERRKQLERILLDDLYRLKMESAETEQLDRIRRLIWSMTKDVYGEPSSDSSRLLKERITAIASTEESSARDREDAEALADRLSELEHALEGIRHEDLGEDLRPCVETIESELSRDMFVVDHAPAPRRPRALGAFDRTRIILNQLYFRYLFPGQAAISGVGRQRERSRTRLRPILGA